MGDEEERAGVPSQRVLERLAALDVEVVRRLVQDQQVRARRDQDREAKALGLAAGEGSDRLHRVVAREQEAPQERPGLGLREAGSRLRVAERREPVVARQLGVLREVPDLHVVADLKPASVELAAADQRLDERGLAAPVRPDQADVLAPLDPHRAVLEQRAVAGHEATALKLQGDLARAFDVPERERERPLVRRRSRDALCLEPLDLLQLRLRLSRLRRLRPEALDESLHAGDLRLSPRNVAPKRQLASRLLRAPRVPGPREEPGPAALELEHRRPHRLEEPAVVGDQDDRSVHLAQIALEPLERLDVEVVGRLVEEQEVGLRGERPSERGPGELAAGEAREVALELGVAEAEAPDRRPGLVPPAVAARMLEPSLGRSRRRRASPRVASVAIRSSSAPKLALDLQHPVEPRDHVLRQRDAAGPGRALVVERHARAPLERDPPGVGRDLARQDPQQGRLARAVAARERHAIAPFELERDVAEQLALAEVLREPGGLDGGQGA